MPEYELDIAPIPLGPRAQRMAAQRRVRQQRRMQANALPEPEMVGEAQPGRGNDSGISEIDVPRYESQEQIRERLQGLAGDVTQAAGQALAQPQPAQSPPAPVAAPPMAAQASQGMPVDDEDEVIGAPPAMDMRATPSTQLRAPMSGAAPQASTPLRAPGVMASLDDEMIGAPSQKGGGWDPELQARAAQADIMRGVAAESADIAEQRRRARIAATIAAGLGASAEQTAAMMAPYDPQIPYQRYEAQQAAQRETADADWRRQLEERRAGIEDRRIAQAESATESRNRRTSAEYDTDSTDAQGMRDLYDATVNSLPEEAQRMLGGMVDVDTTTWNANTMQQALDQLNETVNTLRTTNPRAFRQGQRSTGRQRRGGRLGGTTGGGGTRDYGYGVQAREGGAPLSAEDAAVNGHTPDEIRALRAGMDQDPETGLPAAPRPRPAGGAPRPPRPPQAGAAPNLRQRAPTEAEIAANPELAYQEELIQGAARRMGVDVNTPRGRAAAAVYVDRGMGEGAEDQIMLSGAGSRQRTPEQQRQVEQYVQRYGDVIGREDQLRQLGSTLQRTLSQPNGAVIVRAALHANEGLPSGLANLSSEVTRVRAQIYSFLNEYFSTYGGANVTENELMRYYSAFGAGSVNADPAEFLSAVRRSRQREQSRVGQGARAYPEGARLYYEENAQ